MPSAEAPRAHGMLDVGDGQRIWWEEWGVAGGTPAVYLHGGPGGGLYTSSYRSHFDLTRMRVVGFEQRGCGRSTPQASDPSTSLEQNTTQHLIEDIEGLRKHLGIDAWVVNGVSWGCTLALAYAQRHPERVLGVVLVAVGLTSRREVDWISEGVGAIFREAWDRFAAHAEGAGIGYRRGESRLVEAYAKLLNSPDPSVRDAASHEWALWEDTHISIGAGRFRWDPRPQAPWKDHVETIEPIAARYRAFASQQAAGSSPTFYGWALFVAGSPELLARLATLPAEKQQPNLVFAAARLHGAIPGDSDSLRGALDASWPQVRATILARSTQTNEAARCAALVLGLHHLTGPIALLEVGAAAGLCLIPDRYSYTFNGGSRLDPVTGPSEVTLPITLRGGLTPPADMPDIVWRAGLDLNPLDPADPATVAWLQALVWPEHEQRRQRLTAATRLAARENLRIERGNVLDSLGDLAQRAPSNATLVITHSATLAYLDDEQRRQAVDAITATGARHVSFEGRGVDPGVTEVDMPLRVDTLFVAALDGTPYALADGHVSSLTAVPGPPVSA